METQIGTAGTKREKKAKRKYPSRSGRMSPLQQCVIVFTLLAAMLVILPACKPPAAPNQPPKREVSPAKTSGQESTKPEPPKPDINALKHEIVETYAGIVYATYSDTRTAALTLYDTLNTFVNQPSEANLAAAKAAWQAARIPYLQSEAFRFYNGPIDNPKDGLEPLINAWPIDEAYVDYVKGNPTAGIIANEDAYPYITEELLIELNEKDGEANISTGYHVIEFLLWGQDFNNSGAGTRPVSDYIENSSGPPNFANRRAAYLLKAASLLVHNLDKLTQAWEPNRLDNYRAEFLAQPIDDAIAKILVGITTLSSNELYGERLVVPYETRSQEDEQSCFSDNTHVDIIENAQGIQNVYLGRYQQTNDNLIAGKGIHDFLAITDPTLAAKLTTAIDKTISLAKDIPTPFDQTIQAPENSQSRQSLKRLLENLETQTAFLQQAGGKINSAGTASTEDRGVKTEDGELKAGNGELKTND